MTTQFNVLGPRSLTEHIFGGMIKSLLSPYPNDPRLYTHFLDLNRIPKTTIDNLNFNVVQALNFIANNGNSETDAKVFNIGLNAASELYIKLDGQDDTLGGGNPPSILIDAAGTVHINGTALPLDSTYGFVYEYNTSGITPYNRKSANINLLGEWTDPSTGTERWDNIFFGAPIGPLAWNPVTLPVTTPTNQRILNQSPIPGSVAAGFTTFATQTEPLPVSCVVAGEFFGVSPVPDGALCNNIGHTYSNTPITSNFTASYTLTVGIAKQIYSGVLPNPVSYELVARQDIDVPFRGTFTGTVASFSCAFDFTMTDTDPVTGHPIAYVPFFNHNGIIYPATDANIRWRNVKVNFTTKANIV